MKPSTKNNLQVAVFNDNVGIKEVISKFVNSCKSEENDDPFYCVDVGDVLRKHYKWLKLLPRVEPFYAIKCNTDPLLLQVMTNLNMGFDCASLVEIEIMLNYGVKPSQIVFANPCKQLSHIKFAVKHGVDLMTFDNEMELRKIKMLAPNSRMLLRILTDDSKSLCKLGVKYGAPLHQCKHLLSLAKELGINVIGVSFHVGSGCFDANAFKTAVESARLVFDWAVDIGFNFTLLDVGGGFPGSASKDICFEEVCSVLNDTLDKCFPCDVTIIAEPGRFYASSAFTLVTNITSRKETPCEVSDSDVNNAVTVQRQTDQGYMYYINEGVYGSFNCLLFDHATVEPHLLDDHHNMYNKKKFLSTVWGPSCDSLDCVLSTVHLPKCNVGDWMYFKEMGAYTLSAASGFNGFLPPVCLYFICCEKRQFLEDLLSAKPVGNVKIKQGIEDQCTAQTTIHYIDIPVSHGEA